MKPSFIYQFMHPSHSQYTPTFPAFFADLTSVLFSDILSLKIRAVYVLWARKSSIPGTVNLS